jgi:hypothetical protein
MNGMRKFSKWNLNFIYDDDVDVDAVSKTCFFFFDQRTLPNRWIIEKVLNRSSIEKFFVSSEVSRKICADFGGYQSMHFLH